MYEDVLTGGHSLTVGELKKWLEGIDDDAEVRIAHQPDWPLRHLMAGAVYQDNNENKDEGNDLVDCGDGTCEMVNCKTCNDVEEEDERTTGDPPKILWLVAGDHPYRGNESPYAPKVLWDKI